MHGYVVDEGAGADVDPADGTEERQPSLVVRERRPLYEHGHVTSVRLLLRVRRLNDERRLVDVHDAVDRIVVDLTAEDAVANDDATVPRLAADRHVEAAVDARQRRVGVEGAVVDGEVDAEGVQRDLDAREDGPVEHHLEAPRLHVDFARRRHRGCRVRRCRRRRRHVLLGRCVAAPRRVAHVQSDEAGRRPGSFDVL